MIDTLKLIIAGIAGKLDHHPAARKSIWLLASTAFFAICCTFFAAYVSFSRYHDVAGFLPGSMWAAVLITIGIASFMLFASGYVATWSAERTLKGRSSLPIISVMLVLIAGLVVGVMDYHMNIDGAADVAKSSAGALLSVDSDGIRAKHQNRIDKLQSEIDHIKDPKNPQYKWKGAIIKSGRTEINKLRNQIQGIEDAISEEIARESNTITRANMERDNREEITHDRLIKAVRFVYGVQFFLCLIMAFLGVYMSDALGDEGPVEVIRTVRKKQTHNQEKKEDMLQTSPEQAGQKNETGLYSKTSIGFTGNQTKPLVKRPKTKVKGTRKGKVSSGQVKGVREDALQTMGKIVAAYNGLKQQTDKEPKQKDIAAAAGVSTKTVSRHMKKIKNLNLMNIE